MAGADLSQAPPLLADAGGVGEATVLHASLPVLRCSNGHFAKEFLGHSRGVVELGVFGPAYRHVALNFTHASGVTLQ